MSKKEKKFVKQRDVVGYISEDGKWFNTPYGMWSISTSDKFVEATKEDVEKYKSEVERLKRNREERKAKDKAILDKIGLTEGDFCRFREVYEEEDRITVCTRENGVNGFSIEAAKSPLLIRRYNDEFDGTYAYYEFSKEKKE